MKWRYSILLPLLHMVLSGILIFSEESRTWNFAMFHWSDEEILHLTKPKPGEIAFDPGYEFRPRTGVKVIMGAECPAYLLVGWYGRPPSRNGWLQPTLVRRLQHISPKARVVTLDVVLVLTIGLQWWLVGRWIDDRALGRQGSRRLIPVGIITLSAVIAAGLSPWETNPAVLIADVPVIAAFCGWIVMFVMFAAAGVTSATSKIRGHA
jgi:hypothetical protein